MITILLYEFKEPMKFPTQPYQVTCADIENWEMSKDTLKWLAKVFSKIISNKAEQLEEDYMKINQILKQIKHENARRVLKLSNLPFSPNDVDVYLKNLDLL